MWGSGEDESRGVARFCGSAVAVWNRFLSSPKPELGRRCGGVLIPCLLWGEMPASLEKLCSTLVPSSVTAVIYSYHSVKSHAFCPEFLSHLLCPVSKAHSISMGGSALRKASPSLPDLARNVCRTLAGHSIRACPPSFVSGFHLLVAPSCVDCMHGGSDGSPFQS